MKFVLDLLFDPEFGIRVLPLIAFKMIVDQKYLQDIIIKGKIGNLIYCNYSFHIPGQGQLLWDKLKQKK